MAEKTYSSVNLFIRSLLFSIYSLSTMVIYGTIISLFTWIFPISTRHAFIRFYLRIYFRVLKFLCHIDYEIHGLNNIPKDRAVIIMSKHQSTWETLMLPLIFKNPAIIVKRELMWVPFFGWGLALAGSISINRSKKTSAMHELIVKGTKCLNDGRSILVFPEGTRIPYGSVGHYKLGGARLAVATHHPIIPVAHNAGRFWPRRKFIKRPGTVKMIIGPIIKTEGRTPEEVLHLTKQWIEDTVQILDEKH